ncbi:MAG TPA: LLM class flavin-dependent oxidoreductase [Amycolatopsis sp.]|nr:LLM class flavin-dependent oxidoreductase [Amycolatopsis sp.]
MKVGFTLDFRNPPAHRLPWKQLWDDNLFLLTEAERLGFDSLLVQEHFFTDDGYGPSMPVFLALLAERTTHARIGSWIYVLPLHNPLQLAQETAVLDHLCGGRLDVGIGAGHRAQEYRTFNVSEKQRPSRMEEGIELLRRGWSGETIEHHGKYYDVTRLQVQPTPLQQPHPPLWVGATARPAFERAARHGLNVYAGGGDPADHAAYWRVLEDSGFDPADHRVALALSITVTDEDPEEVWRRNEEHYVYRWDFYRRIRAELGDKDIVLGAQEGIAAGDVYRGNELIGTPETVLNTIAALKEQLRFTDLVLLGPAAGIELRGEGLRGVERFAQDVLPMLHKW